MIPNGAENFEEVLSQAVEGYRRFCLLRAAIELEIFDLLREPMSAERIAEKLNLNTKLTKLFCRALASMGLLEVTEGRFVASKLARNFLQSDSKYSQLIRLKKLFRDQMLWLRLAELLRGPLIVRREGFFPEVIHSMAQHCLLGELQRTVEIVSSYPEFRSAKKLLDLGGGHGLYAQAFVETNPKLEAVVFDLPEVVEEARRYINNDRVKFIAGDFFRDDIGCCYDIIFSSYNPSGKSLTVLDKIAESLNAGGLYVNKQYFPRDDFTLDDLDWNLWTFEGIEKGESRYTFASDLSLEEYINELVARGFEVLDVHDFGGAKMIIAKKY